MFTEGTTAHNPMRQYQTTMVNTVRKYHASLLIRSSCGGTGLWWLTDLPPFLRLSSRLLGHGICT